MERWRGRVALVTGASSGIGYSVTKALVERGMKVVACARNIDAIQKLAEELSGQPGSLTAVKCDVSKEEEVGAMFQTIRQHSSLGRVDVCINNAGLAHNAPLLTGDPAQWRHMFDVNVLGLMMVIKEAFTLMEENNIDDGHIILVNSISGVQVLKTKQVCPGLVKTDFLHRLYGQEYATTVFASMKSLQADDIRDSILYILDAPPHVEINDVLLRPTEQPF